MFKNREEKWQFKLSRKGEKKKRKRARLSNATSPCSDDDDPEAHFRAVEEGLIASGFLAAAETSTMDDEEEAFGKGDRLIGKTLKCEKTPSSQSITLMDDGDLCIKQPTDVDDSILLQVLENSSSSLMIDGIDESQRGQATRKARKGAMKKQTLLGFLFKML